MRLTLRTLLAYLDDILEPKQTKDIGEKVADSHFATSLTNRIREVLRRRRLTAPPLSGPGAGLDPNAVAEYLDNTLAPEKVADVEKTCLESDVHLAEMAGCHQILTLVLGEPVDIVPESRERIYALTAPATVVAPAPAVAVKEPETAQPVPKPKKAAPKPVSVAEDNDFRAGIPDYLRKPPLWKRMLPWASVAIVALVLVVVLQPNSETVPTVADKNDHQTNSPAADLVENADAPGNQSEPEEAPAPPPDSGKAFVAEAPVGDDLESEVAQSDPPEETDGKIDSPQGVDAPAPLDDDVDDDGKSNIPTGAAVVLSEIESVIDDPVFGDDVSEAPAKKEAPPLPPVTDAPEVDGEDVPELKPAEVVETKLTKEPEDQVAVVETKIVETVEEEEPKKFEEPPAVKEVVKPPVTAQYMSPSGILLIDDLKEGGWFKLAPRSIINPGDRVAVPEPFNASLRFSEGDTHLTLLSGGLNGTSIEFIGPTEAARCTIRVHRGRMVFRGGSTGDGIAAKPVTLGFLVGDEIWQVKFLTPDAVWGMEIVPRQPEQFEQNLGEKTFTGALYVQRGKIQFNDGKQLKIEKAGPGWIPLTPGQRPGVNENGDSVDSLPLRTLPSWLGLTDMSADERKNGRLFSKEFDEIQPIEISLVGAVDHRHEEISSLAIKCFSLTKNYQRLADALAQSQYEKSRRVAVDGLRDWLPTDPGNAEKLKVALAKVFHPEDAEIVYRLVWGIHKSQAQLLKPSGELVELMGHEKQVIRELAFDQVLRLTGNQRKLDYRPNDTEKRRINAINRWQSLVQRHGGLIRKQ